MTKTAIVLGAGIQGTCVALMLQKHGYKVQLIDKSHDIINRASLTFEGKIHLGLVYGMDTSMQTGYKMIRDALNFAPYIQSLLEHDIDWQQLKSNPNIYLAARNSMLSLAESENYFEKLSNYFRDCLSDRSLHYLGARPHAIHAKINMPDYISPEYVSAAFLTEEVSVDQLKLKNMIRQKITSLPSIDVFLEHQVKEIKSVSSGFSVECTRKDGISAYFKSEVVFNCLWEKRIYFDHMMGINSEINPSLRLKYGLFVQADDFLRNLHSLTIIHGAYGSLVINPNIDEAFFSWYPASMKGLLEYGDISEDWEKACDGYVSVELTETLRIENLKGFQQYIPNLSDLKPLKVTAGVIVAEGTKDITENDSGFHSRNEIPIYEKAGYYSINTSKYTSAPNNTMILERMLFN